MQKVLFVIIILVAPLLGQATTSAQNEIIFLNQTKTVGGQLEWNREIIANQDGTIRIKIQVKEGGKFSTLLVRDEDYQVISGKKPEPEKFKPQPIIITEANNSFEKVQKLEKGTYWFIIENQEQQEKNINLICSQIK
jgi:hypothetical protein